ncbi:MAG: HD domain-containing protein [Clostridia bacterium]|nr:HD domain-containing protein [Clostridia bacterium]
MSINAIKLSSSAEKVLGTLTEKGYAAYLVGGAVRDFLLGKPVCDYDVATSALPEHVIAVFGEKNCIKTGLKHGTVTVLAPKPVEVTTFRKDGDYFDMRRPETVEFLSDIKEDLQRRDFTVNAMAYSPKDGLIDYFGGLQDLKNKVIRAVGDPYKRFEEDALRILRALRFSSKLGFKIEEKTSAAIRELKKNLSAVSKERIFSELSKLVCGEYAAEVLSEYAEVIFEILPELKPCYKFEQHSKWHRYDVYEHIVRSVGYIKSDETLRFAMLFHDAGKPKKFFIGKDGAGHFYGHAKPSAYIAASALKRLKAPNKLINDVFLLVLEHDKPIKGDDISIKKKLKDLGEKTLFDLIEVKKADHKAQGTVLAEEESKEIFAFEEAVKKIIERGDCYKISSLAVRGDDLKEIGFSGKEIGETLDALLNDVICGNLPNDRERLLKSAEKRFNR